MAPCSPLRERERGALRALPLPIGWANLPDPSEVDDFGTGITEEAEELGLDRGDPFDIDLPPEDPWDHEENI